MVRDDSRGLFGELQGTSQLPPDARGDDWPAQVETHYAPTSQRLTKLAVLERVVKWMKYAAKVSSVK